MQQCTYHDFDIKQGKVTAHKHKVSNYTGSKKQQTEPLSLNAWYFVWH